VSLFFLPQIVNSPFSIAAGTGLKTQQDCNEFVTWRLLNA